MGWHQTIGGHVDIEQICGLLKQIDKLLMIRLRSCCFGATSYLIDADYPMETYLEKKSSCRQTGELCSNRPEIATPAQKINLDNKTRFG